MQTTIRYRTTLHKKTLKTLNAWPILTNMDFKLKHVLGKFLSISMKNAIVMLI